MSTERISTFLVSIVLVLVVVATTVYLYLELKSNRVEKIVRDEGVIHVLFLFQSEGALEDAVLVFFGANTMQMGSVNIPRNTAILRKNPTRMLPLDSGYSPRSASSLVNTLAAWLDVTIHYSVTVDLDQDLPKLIDLVKGVSIDTGSGARELVDGSRYMQLRAANAIDYQAVLIDVLLRLGADFEQYVEGVGFSLLRSLISSDMSRDSLRSLLRYIEKRQTNHAMHIALEGALRAVNGVDELLLFPFEEGRWIRHTLQTLDRVLREGPRVHPFSISLEILNGTTREGLAQRTANYFRSLGFQAISVDNAESNTLAFTAVQGSAANAEKIEYVQEILGVSNGDYVTSLRQGADVIIILGQNFDESSIQ